MFIWLKARFPYIVIFLALLMGSFWWYMPKAALSATEVDRYMARIEQQDHIFASAAANQRFRAFLEADDGEAFYTLNYYKFREKAQYDADLMKTGTAESGLSGEDAYTLFSTAMVKLLAAQASHPIFGTEWLADTSGAWDRLVIVRYRNRRDIAEIYANPKFGEISHHKWAALASGERQLASAVHIPSMHYPIFLLAFFVSLGLAYGFNSLLRIRRPTK
jgi:hypothetical protein